MKAIQNVGISVEHIHTGAYIGMYASSEGKNSDNAADFDWFEYIALTE
ncbi:hypothetical protein [Paenibacillus sp. An7]|nr:hypothetical protein [Paenibacillus sp. An7]